GWRSRRAAAAEGGRIARRRYLANARSWLGLRCADAGAQAKALDLLDEMAIGAGAGAFGRGQRTDQRLHECPYDAGGGNGRIEPLEGAAHDAFAQDALEAMGELCAVLQAHGLDLGIDRLRNDGVSQPPPAQGAAG